MKLPMQLLLPLLLVAALVSPPWQQVAAACLRRCGGVDIPYPFGIGPGCYLDTGDGHRTFELTCNRTSDGGGSADGGPLRPTTVVDGFEVLQIDELRGKMRVRSPVISRCVANQTNLTYDSSSFRVSGADNKLVVVGCNASAYVDMWDSDFDNSYRVACRAVCLDGEARPSLLAPHGSGCNGTDGCCQAPIPPRIMYFNMGFLDDVDGKSSSSSGSSSSACSQQAMLVEKTTTYLTAGELVGGAGALHHVSAVLDWTAGRQRCEEAQRNKTAYACNNPNAACLDSDNGPGDTVTARWWHDGRRRERRSCRRPPSPARSCRRCEGAAASRRKGGAAPAMELLGGTAAHRCDGAARRRGSRYSLRIGAREPRRRDGRESLHGAVTP